MSTDNSTPDYIEMPITKGYIAILSPEDADLTNYKWIASISIHKSGVQYPYVKRTTYTGGKKTVTIHRVIMARMLGRMLTKDELVDHKNNDVLDNRRQNLRLANRSQNGGNARLRTDNTSGYKGVSYFKHCPRKPWNAAIQRGGKQWNLGQFKTAEEAYAAYCEAAKEVHGEFWNPGI